MHGLSLPQTHSRLGRVTNQAEMFSGVNYIKAFEKSLLVTMSSRNLTYSIWTSFIKK